jgi:hypothetical protein
VIVVNHSNKRSFCYHSNHGRNNVNKLNKLCIVLGLSQCHMKDRHMKSQCPTHYSLGGGGGIENVLDIVVHKNIRLSNVIVSDILDSDHLPVLFHILDHVRLQSFLAPTEKFTDWERFQSLASKLISPRIKINSGVEGDKAARTFTASIASAYRLSTSKITFSDLNSDLPGLDRLLKCKKK